MLPLVPALKQQENPLRKILVEQKGTLEPAFSFPASLIDLAAKPHSIVTLVSSARPDPLFLYLLTGLLNYLTAPAVYTVRIIAVRHQQNPFSAFPVLADNRPALIPGPAISADNLFLFLFHLLYLSYFFLTRSKTGSRTFCHSSSAPFSSRSFSACQFRPPGVASLANSSKGPGNSAAIWDKAPQ